MKRIALVVAAASAASLPQMAFAADEAQPLDVSLGADSELPSFTDRLPPVMFGAVAMGDDLLGAIAGREDVNQIANADLAATVTRNSVGSNSVTGDARISDNAFQNMSGLSILNVNTGNNVAFNAAMNVNISINGL